MIKLIIADDHPIVRQGIKQILTEEADMKLMGEATNGGELMGMIRALPCDVVLLDIGMPGKNGLDVLHELRCSHPKLPALVLSIHPEDQYGPRVLKAGAAGYMSKEIVPDELVNAIRKVAGGRKYISPSLAEKLACDLGAHTEKPPHEFLSDREYQVMCMIASGKTVGEIGRALFLSAKTISTHRARILEKMKMKTNAQLTFYALQSGLASP